MRWAGAAWRDLQDDGIDIDLANQLVVDGTTDNTALIQGALDTAASRNPDSDSYGRGQVKVRLRPGRISCGPITIPPGVTLDMRSGRLIARSAGYQVTMSNNARIRRGILDGNSGLANVEGLLTPGGENYGNIIEDVFFWNHWGRAINDSAYSTYMDLVNVQNALLGSFTNAAAPWRGAIELRRNDAYVNRCAAASSPAGFNGPGSASLRAAALAIFNPNNVVTNFLAQVADVGIYIGPAATETTMKGIRCELCFSHGMVIAGGSGQITNARMLRNNRGNVGAGGLYQEGGAEFIVTDLFVKGQDTATNREAFGLRTFTFANFPSSTYRNIYIRDVITPVIENGEGMTSIEATRRGKPVTLTGATPSLFAQNQFQENFEMGNTSATLVTNFRDGLFGQHLLVRGDGFSTLQHGTNIFTTTGANKLMASGVYYQFVRRANGTWAEF